MGKDINNIKKLIEEIAGQNVDILGAVKGMQKYLTDIPSEDDDLVRIEKKVDTFRAVLNSSVEGLRTLENRVTLLERAV